MVTKNGLLGNFRYKVGREGAVSREDWLYPATDINWNELKQASNSYHLTIYLGQHFAFFKIEGISTYTWT